MARTATVIQAEIDEINTTLSQIRKAGQAYVFTSASGAGTSRSVTMADYKTLKDDRKDLENELATVNGTRAMRFGSSW